MCVCRNPKFFLETGHIRDLPFHVGCVTFDDLRAIQLPLRVTTRVDKVIIFTIPNYLGMAWDIISGLPISLLIIYSNHFTGFSQPQTPPPPFALPPPSYRAPSPAHYIFSPSVSPSAAVPPVRFNSPPASPAPSGMVAPTPRAPPRRRRRAPLAPMYSMHQAPPLRHQSIPPMRLEQNSDDDDEDLIILLD